jgi:hypothetical protein
MGSVAGQTLTGRINRDIYFAAAVNSAVGATLTDGSRLICKAGGVAWFAAPASTQISIVWANGIYCNSVVGAKCCVSEWGTLNSLLSSTVCLYSATNWFVPSVAQLQNPGFVCRTNWGTPTGNWWSSTEVNATNACLVVLSTGNAYSNVSKQIGASVRAFRCVTY